MLHALLEKKLYRELARHPRDIEDLLTSVVFGSCLYAGDAACWLFPFLARASALQGAALAVHLQDARAVDIQFWPRWDADEQRVVVDGGEPDVLLRLGDGRQWHSMLLLEAKLWSGKSSRPSASGRVTDQLGKYWLGLKRRAEQEGLRAIGVVYLTSGLSLPRSELEETQAELVGKGHEPAPLYWLSWRQFHKAFELDAAPPVLRDAVRLVRDEWELVDIEMGAWPAQTTRPRPWRFEESFAWPDAARAFAPWTFDL